MGALLFNFPTLVRPISIKTDVHKLGRIQLASANIQFCRHQKIGARFQKIQSNFSYSSSESDDDDDDDEDEDPEDLFQEPMVPGNWFEPSKASEKIGARFPKLQRNFSYSSSPNDGDEGPENSVKEPKVPSHWFEPSKASEEAEWLRVTLNKWLDDEYCPEATNIEISKVAANSYYQLLVEETADLGEILIRIAMDLESLSYQESFHGPFSSATAAVNLIIQRLSPE